MTSAAAATTETTTKARRKPVLEALQEMLAEGRTAEVVALVTKLVSRNSELERRLQEARRRPSPREGVSTAQLTLLLGGLAANDNPNLAEADAKLRAATGLDEKQREEESRPAQGRKPRLALGRQPLPAHLERVRNVISVPEAQRPCPLCGVPRTCIHHEVTEVLDLIPARVVVRQDIREKLACKPCDGELVRAPLGDKAVAGGRMGTALVAQVIVDKYRDGLPLARQVERFQRMGIAVAISTLADQVRWAAEALEPLWRAALVKAVQADVLHLDATSLAVLARDIASGIRLGTIWGYVGADVSDEGTRYTAVCLYASTGKRTGQRPGELGPDDVLARRKGDVVADASTLFDNAFRREELRECGCNMHARRRFTKALESGDARAALPLAAFKRLYDIEREVKSAPIETRRRVRAERSQPVYDELLAWARAHRPFEPPSTPLGKALQYLENHHVALRRFLGSGVIPPDNGPVERLHVRTAMTRKAFLFAGSDAGAQRAAIAYTLLGCCALEDVDPVAYLADVLPKLTTKRVRQSDMAALLPAAWKAARAARASRSPAAAA